MCGIAGIFLKTSSLEPKLGSMLSAMLTTLSNRGPDSAGFAVYGKRQNNLVKLTLRLPPGPDITDALISAAKEFSLKGPTFHANHAIVSVPADKLQAMQSFFRDATSLDGIEIVGNGTRMEISNDVGLPPHRAHRSHLP